MLGYAAFMLVILAANVMQGITGFAGTILAMPPSLMLVGYPVAKPVLNVLGLLSGVYVFVGQRKQVRWDEVRRIVAVMAAGIVVGVLIQGAFEGREQVLYRCLGAFIVVLALQGGWVLLHDGRTAGEGGAAREASSETVKVAPQGLGARMGSLVLLSAAGIVHGIFVSGGPLLIGYLTRRLADKASFRATISTVWIFLNGLVLVQDVMAGRWTPGLLVVQAVSIPFLLAGMFIGARLYARMDQRLFMLLTYALLLISGISLLVK